MTNTVYEKNPSMVRWELYNLSYVLHNQIGKQSKFDHYATPACFKNVPYTFLVAISCRYLKFKPPYLQNYKFNRMKKRLFSWDIPTSFAIHIKSPYQHVHLLFAHKLLTNNLFLPLKVLPLVLYLNLYIFFTSLRWEFAMTLVNGVYVFIDISLFLSYLTAGCSKR